MKTGRTMQYHRAVISVYLAAFCLFSIPVFSQETIPILQDTAKVETIPLEMIPVKSGEAVVQAIRMAESLISDDEIASIRLTNDQLMANIDSSLVRQKDIDLSALYNRYLQNQIIYWIDYESQVDRAKSSLTATIKSLNDKQESLNQQLSLWNNTRAITDPVDLGSTFDKIISGVTVKIDSVNGLISQKTIELVQILNDATLRGIDIEDVVNKINSENLERQAHVLVKTEPTLWQINYTERANWRMINHIRFFYESDLILLKQYYVKNEFVLVYYLVFLLLLVLLFRHIKKIFNRVTFNKEVSSIYEQAGRQILSKPVSAALILGLFSSILFFSNRPLIFMDMLVLLVSIPLMCIVSTIGTFIRIKYVYLFGFIILLRFVNYIFPTDFLFHRLLIFIMATCEVIFFLGLLRDFKAQNIKNHLLNSLIKLILILHIAIVFLGVAGNIFGSVRMADQAVNLVVTDTFVGFLIFVSSVIIIGLIHFALDGNYLKKFNIVKSYNSLLKAHAVWWTLIIGSWIWLSTTLKALGLYEILYNYFREFFSAEYKWGANGTFTIGSILLFFLVIWLSVVASKIIRVVMEEDILERLPLKKGVPRMISVMTRYTLVVIGVFVAVSLAGMSLDSLTIVLGAFSVGIGFGLQNIFNNLVSGLILLFERPIQIGDVVEVGTLVGHVKSMGIRSSNLRTFDGAEVIVPNGHLISNEVINWTLSDNKRRIEILSGVAYGSDVHKVQALFLKILDDHPDVLKLPAPMAYFNDLGESSLDFRLLFWTDNFDEWLRIRSEVVFKIYDVLNEEGIEIPFPQRDLHIKSGNGNIKT